MSFVLGVTGGSGCGKSAASVYFQNKGAHIIDADKIARKILEPGTPATAEVLSVFPEVLVSEGIIERKKLADIVFHDKDKLDRLNTITHGYIIQEIKHQLAECSAALAVIDAPLLFEANLEKLCHTTLGILANRSLRIDRIMHRDGLTMDQAAARIDAQKDDGFYRTNCHYIVENNGDVTELHRALDAFLKELLA